MGFLQDLTPETISLLTSIDRDSFFKQLGGIVLEEFSGITLIGEIERPKGKETYEVLQVCLREWFRNKSDVYVILHGTKQWRAVLSLYFVWTGIFTYGIEQRHELWPHIFKGLGIPYRAQIAQRYGKLFMECLKENGLERFEALETGHLYTTRILLHGLIPEVAINRFVQELIIPELSGAMSAYADGGNVIDKWCQAPLLQYLPKPIQRFVQYGRPINTYVVDRFLDMARRWDEDDPIFWKQWGLPQYMVNAFRHCKDGRVRGGKRERHARVLTGDRSHLFFDLERSEQPLLAVPPQSTPLKPSLRVSYEPLGHLGITENVYAVMSTQIEGTYYSDPQELSVGPAQETWFVEFCDMNGRVLFKKSFQYQFPLTAKGQKLPLFFFHAETSKLLNMQDRRAVPEEIIIVYPQDANLRFEGGFPLTEPLDLCQPWDGWQYVRCHLGQHGTLFYRGPSTSLVGAIEAPISFQRGTEPEQPMLQCPDETSLWLQCPERWPIFMSSQRINIHCHEEAYAMWRRAVGKLVRLDVSQTPRGFSLDFRATDRGYSASLPQEWGLEPGVYTIQLRGALGVDDVFLPFIYLPLHDCEKVQEVDSEGLVSRFRLSLSHPVDLLPLTNTHLDFQDQEVIVSLQEDGGEAFCALKMFAHSQRPVTLLLARSDVRWCRRRGSSAIAWDVWRAKPDEIPMQRVDEIKDARVLVQIDQSARTSVKRSRKRLSLVLRSPSTAQRVLMSYEAPTLQHNMQNTWIIDLKPFSDQLKALDDVQIAEILVDFGRRNGYVPLFTLLRYPEFKDFCLSLIDASEQLEKYRVTWTPQPNDPVTNRVLVYFPIAESAELTEKLPDGAAPPLR
jgi:hypothetical protein